MMPMQHNMEQMLVTPSPLSPSPFMNYDYKNFVPCGGVPPTPAGVPPTPAGGPSTPSYAVDWDMTAVPMTPAGGCSCTGGSYALPLTPQTVVYVAEKQHPVIVVAGKKDGKLHIPLLNAEPIPESVGARTYKVRSPHTPPTPESWAEGYKVTSPHTPPQLLAASSKHFSPHTPWQITGCLASSSQQMPSQRKGAQPGNSAPPASPATGKEPSQAFPLHRRAPMMVVKAIQYPQVMHTSLPTLYHQSPMPFHMQAPMPFPHQSPMPFHMQAPMPFHMQSPMPFPMPWQIQHQQLPMHFPMVSQLPMHAMQAPWQTQQQLQMQTPFMQLPTQQAPLPKFLL
jgi:hypothetical protein